METTIVQFDAMQPQLDPSKLQRVLRRRAEQARKAKENKRKGYSLKRRSAN